MDSAGRDKKGSYPKNHILMPAAFFMAQGGYSIYFGFLVSYLTKEGMNSTTIGFILMLCALFNLFSQPLMGFISDTYFPSKRILLTTVSVSIPLSFVLPVTVSIPIVAVLSIILMAMMEYSFAICLTHGLWDSMRRAREFIFLSPRGWRPVVML